MMSPMPLMISSGHGISPLSMITGTVVPASGKVMSVRASRPCPHVVRRQVRKLHGQADKALSSSDDHIETSPFA
jgi:hypothetical protein